MLYPKLSTAMTEAAVMGYGVLFEHINPDGTTVIGVVWWDGDFRKFRGLKWI